MVGKGILDIASRFKTELAMALRSLLTPPNSPSAAFWKGFRPHTFSSSIILCASASNCILADASTTPSVVAPKQSARALPTLADSRAVRSFAKAVDAINITTIPIAAGKYLDILTS
jgi:hypothetical protein